ncbi:MAG: hypothetical protein BAA04_11575 [Firmicutes bacterium ZCTH02-B6]|nr:MAG: hypothetical protein BAA04_11575 [Firmicutes bacterium ZCTH02-B6]
MKSILNYGRMAARNTIHEQIVACYDRLGQRQRLLADLLLSDSARVAMMSSAELARAAGVSEATVVRFAQSLGFAGYPEMRQYLQQNLLKELGSSQRLASTVQETSPASPLRTIVATTQRHLEQLLQNVTDDQISAAVQRILRARRVFIFGEGAPASATHLAEFWLRRLGCHVIRINQTGRRFFDHAFTAGAGDLGIVLVFRRLLPEPKAFVEHLAQESGESIVITDLVQSPIHGLASQVLLVQRSPMEAFRPMGAVTAIVDALILGVMQAKGEEGVALLRRLDAFRERYGFL